MAQQIDLLKNSSYENKMDELIEVLKKERGSDYNYLDSKPSINGNVLEGDKTNEELGIPTKTSDLVNNSNFVVDANYTHTDNNYTNAEKTSVGTIKDKVDKVAGKGLSTNDLTNDLKNSYDDAVNKAHTHVNKDILDNTTASFTTEEKNKLKGIADGAEVNVQSDWNEKDDKQDSYIKNKPSIPSKTSDLTNDTNFVEDADYVHTDNNYTTADKNSVATIKDKVDKVDGKGLSTNDLTDELKADYDDAVLKAHTHVNKDVLDNITASYTTEEKTKLDGIEDGAQKNTVTGVKGDAETSYREGNVNITKANIGLRNVANERQWSANNHPTTISGYGITDAASNDSVTTLTNRVKTNEDNISTLDTNVKTLQTDVSTIKNNYVPKTRKVNGKALSADITLSADDVKAIPASQKGAANGVAELDENGLIKSSNLPSYVDDVLEYDTITDFPTNGESGKIYIAIDTNLQYRWTGTQYAEISPSLALGETSSTAYRGDRGKIAYDHSQLTSGNPHKVTKTDVGLSNVPNVSTNNQAPTFTQASSRVNIISGEKLSVLFGKIMKWFADLGTAAFKNVASSGNADTTQVVMGNDTRLTDARKASDVYPWAKAETKPTYTKSEVGLGNVPNVTTDNQTPSFTQATTLANIVSKETLSTMLGKISKAIADLISHIGNKSNPHSVTKAQVGLGNVGNFKAVSTVANQGLTDAEKSNARTNIGAGTSSFSGSYNDLSNKPTLGTASEKDVPTTGNASTTQVVMGNDTRLSDARKASDVYSWAKAETKPSYTKSEVGLGNVDNTADSAKSVKYATSANSASKATGVVDYGSTANIIQIGYAGKGVTTDNLTHIAGYIENGTRIKDVSKNTLKSWLGLGSLAYSSATIPTIPSSLPANGGNSTTVNGHTVNSDVPANAKFTDTTYTVATESAKGLMSSTDKTKLDNTNIAYGTCTDLSTRADKSVTIDNNTNWTLKVGSIITVKFTNTNLVPYCTLNVNSTGTKSIWYNGAAYTGSAVNVTGSQDNYITYMYDGTYWVWLGAGVLNSRFNDGLVKAGSSYRNKVWKTDSQGIPDWRDETSAITVDSALSSTSKNPVQNKVVNTAIDNLGNDIDEVSAIALAASKSASTSVVYGMCALAQAGNASKVITLDDTSASLRNGTILAVLYKGTNTAVKTSQYSLRVNNVLIPIYVSGLTLTSSNTDPYPLYFGTLNYITYYVYDSTNNRLKWLYTDTGYFKAVSNSYSKGLAGLVPPPGSAASSTALRPNGTWGYTDRLNTRTSFTSTNVVPNEFCACSGTAFPDTTNSYAVLHIPSSKQGSNTQTGGAQIAIDTTNCKMYIRTINGTASTQTISWTNWKEVGLGTVLKVGSFDSSSATLNTTT